MSANSIYYTYLITHKPSGQFYYGVRYAKGCHPDDLWNTYFTSSKYVKQLIESDGQDSFTAEVRRTFENVETAVDWESKVLSRIIEHPLCLNRAVFSNQCLSVKCSEETKEKLRNRVVTEETRKKMSEARKGMKFTDEHKNKIATTQRRKKNGVPLSEAHKLAISKGTKGCKKPKRTKAHREALSKALLKHYKEK